MYNLLFLETGLNKSNTELTMHWLYVNTMDDIENKIMYLFSKV